jgi:hypothetical protein
MWFSHNRSNTQHRIVPWKVEMCNSWKQKQSHIFFICHKPAVPSLSLSLSLWLYSPLDLGCFFSFLFHYTAGRTPWTEDQPFASPLLTHRITLTQNKRTQTWMPWVEFEPTIPAFERAKTVHVSDRAATVTGSSNCNGPKSNKNTLTSC